MVRQILWTALVAAGLGAQGCYSFQSCIDDSLISMRNSHEACRAWWACRGIYKECEPHLHHFGEGFRAGYQAVAEGGNGCPPALPPHHYWKGCYQSEKGREKVVAWYNGYSHGAFMAQSEGLPDRNRIVTAYELYRKNSPVVAPEIPLPSEQAIDTEEELLESMGAGHAPELVPPAPPSEQ